MILKRKKTLKHKRITVGDIGISYLIKEGTASMQTQAPLIFIHGFPFNKNMWRAQLTALPDHITGIAIDVRGHGQSTMGHGFFSIDLFAQDLIELMRSLNIPKAICCGVSMGGYIALRAYERAPEKFTGLILSDTNAISDDNEGKIKRFDTIKSVLQHGTRTFSINFTSKVFSKRSIAQQIDALELIKSSIRRNNVRSICATLLALASRTDTTAVLKQIQVPTLILWGLEDQVTPIEQATPFLEQILEVQAVTFEHCGHLPNLEAPEAFNEALLKYLSRLK